MRFTPLIWICPDPGINTDVSLNCDLDTAQTSSARWPYLGRARAYAMQGDTANARAAYSDFLALWKDADPDIPILMQAQAEYAALQREKAVDGNE
jgi:predicted Zn-dependent protease